MHVYVDLILTWVLFLALFPMTFVWYRQAWRIAVKRDFSSVALKGGESPPNPAKFAPFALALNLVAATVTLSVIIGIVSATLPKDEWTAMAGVTIWCKLIFNYAISRHAHLGVKSERKLAKSVPSKKRRRASWPIRPPRLPPSAMPSGARKTLSVGLKTLGPAPYLGGWLWRFLRLISSWSRASGCLLVASLTRLHELLTGSYQGLHISNWGAAHCEFH